MIINKNWLGRVYRNDDPADDGGTPPPADPPAPNDDHAPNDPPAPFYDALPDDWRTQVVGSMGIEDEAEREKAENMLNRVTDFKSFAKNYVEAQQKIRSGLKDDSGQLPEGATEEQVKEWREANGVPESPEAYELALDDGLVLGDDDKRIMGEVFKDAHSMNLSTDQMSKLTNSMMRARQTEEQAMVQQDGIDTQTTERQLRDAWGQDYETNINAIKGFASKLPESIRDDFLSARLANGQALFANAEASMFFADMARQLDPAGTVVPNSNNPVQSINDEITKLESQMGTDAWYKDNASQKRYQDLVTARDRMK